MKPIKVFGVSLLFLNVGSCQRNRQYVYSYKWSNLQERDREREREMIFNDRKSLMKLTPRAKHIKSFWIKFTHTLI